MMLERPLVSIIIPIHNGEKWIDDCFDSILKQEILNTAKIEISVYNDASTDNTKSLLEKWCKKILEKVNLSMVVKHSNKKIARGVGYAKNKAVKQSSGLYLCFQDVDDIMMPRRLCLQLEEIKKHPDSIIGCQVKRIPDGSTPRLIKWVNNIPQNLLTTQIYTSHGPTVLMPTWFLSRETFEKVGSFSEKGAGTPEDLLFFYSHLDQGGTIWRVEEILLLYRYHPHCTTFTISKETIWNVRLKHFEDRVLSKWSRLTIWNAGKQGRRFYRCLKPSNRLKVSHFCDVDPKKIGKFYEPHDKSSDPKERRKIPIVRFEDAEPPLVTCVKLDMTGGQFEENLKSLNLKEGRDYYVFS